MSSIIRLNASSFSPKSICSPPIESQFTAVSLAAGCQPLAAIKASVRTKPVTIAPMEIRLLTVLLRKVKSVITTADSSGRNKISQGNNSNFIFLKPQMDTNGHEKFASNRFRIRVDSCPFVVASQFHARQIFDVRGLAFAVERHDQREADRHLRRRHGDDEKHQHLAVELVVESRKGDER